jgi:hypothetical protein
MKSLSNSTDYPLTQVYSVDGILSSVACLESRPPIMMIVTLTLESAIGVSFIV